jgi:cytochrome c
MMDFQATTPLPRDIPLSLPADNILLQALLVMLFLIHILFVNLMVGGAWLALIMEIVGRKRADFDQLAQEITKTITVNKSLAVVLGVGPLLAINVLYTVYFYSANALTGSAWISIVPLVVAAFLVSYAHKYSWHRLAHVKDLHIALSALAAVLFALIPLIFLTNVNLMLFPERWLQVHGFLSSLGLPNVLPRYLHFMLASVAITALFLLFYFTRPAYPVERVFASLDRPALRRLFYSVALGASLLQLLAGPLLLVTLPRQGMSWYLLLLIAVGAGFGITAMVLMWREVVSPCLRPSRRFAAVFLLVTLTAFTMGYGRHVYRETAVTDHRAAMANATRQFGWLAASAQRQAASGIQLDDADPGEKIFKSTCAACHAVDRILVGPPLTEIVQIYAGNPDGIAQWAQKPGKKRPGMPPMPAFRLGADKLQAVARHMLKLGSEPGTAPAEDGAEAS